MKLWWASSLLLLGLAMLVSAQTPDDPVSADKGAGGPPEEDPQELNMDPTYRKESGYYLRPPRPAHYGGGRYGGAGYRGAQRRGYRGYNDFHPRNRYGGGSNDDHYTPDAVDPLTHLYARLEDVQSLMKTWSEVLGSLEAQLSLEKKKLDEFTQQTSVAIDSKEKEQTRRLGDMQMQLEGLQPEIAQFTQLLAEAGVHNNLVLNGQEAAQVLLASENKADTLQDGLIAELSANAKDLKEKLLQVMGNRLGQVRVGVTNGQNFFDVVKGIEHSRMCETGQVTLDSDDRKAEYLFQTTFGSVPQVLYGICGYNVDLDAKQDHRGYQDHYGYGRGYGYGGYGDGYGGYKNDYDYKRPNFLGLTVPGPMVSKTGATFELFDRSFGRTAVGTVDVCFQVCTTGPHDDLQDVMLWY